MKKFPLTIFTFGVLVFFSFTTCVAQSVVGKWKQLSGKNYFTPEAIKNSHGHLQDVMDMRKMDLTDDFHADNTLTETVISEGVKTITTCTWTQSGNTIKITKDHETLSGIISGNGTTLVLSMLTPISKREWTYSKI